MVTFQIYLQYGKLKTEEQIIGIPGTVYVSMCEKWFMAMFWSSQSKTIQVSKTSLP